MIKSNELRVGNYYQHNGNWSYRDHSSPKIIKWEERDWYAVGECTMSLDDLDGIPITEELLVRLGFEKQDLGDDAPYEWFINKKVDKSIRIWDFNETGQWIINIEDSYEKDGFYYIHQLQNLYFSLTGEELTFKY